MMDFISIPLVVGIVTLGIYKLFELFVRKKERLTIIEKMGDKFLPSMIENPFSVSVKTNHQPAFNTLKFACLLLGMGLGMLVGFFITLNTIGIFQNDNWQYRETQGAIYGASILLFGGLGLLLSFLIELNHQKKS